MSTPNQSNDMDKLIIRCDNADGIIAAIGDLMPKLPKEIARTLDRIMLQILGEFGEEGLFERANNRSVASLIEEFEADLVPPIERGELEGLKYELYDKSPNVDETP